METIINPNYKPPAIELTRPPKADQDAIAGIASAWDDKKPTISTHQLANEFAKQLTKVQIDEIQAKYPRGLGDYIEALIS